MDDPRQKENYFLYKTIPFRLNNHPPARVAIYTVPSKFVSIAMVQVWDPNLRQWISKFTLTGDNPDSFKIATGYWKISNTKVLLLTTVSGGSGSFLSYLVAGYDGRQFLQYIKQEELFQGGVRFFNSQIIYNIGNQYWIWVFKDNKLQPELYRVPVIPRAQVIYYAIQPGDEVQIDQTQLTIPMGSLLQIIRTDGNPITDRLLISGQGVEYIPFPPAFRLTTRGRIEITIIPSAYNWDKAVNVNVEVV